MNNPFFEYNWVRAEVSYLPEVDIRRQKRVRGDGVTPHVGRNLFYV